MKSRPYSRPILFIFLGLTSVFVLGYYLVFILSIPLLRFSPLPPTEPVEEIIDFPGVFSTNLEPGDRILAFGGIPIEDYMKPGGASINSLLKDGNVLPLTIDRDGKQINVNWQVVRPDAEYRWRRSIQFIPAIGFLIASLLAAMFLRATDERVQLLVTMFALYALWLAARIVGFYNVFLADAAMRVALWMLIPVSLHFGWIYPQPLRRLPVWTALGLYFLGAGLALAEYFRLIPGLTYSVAFLTITLGLSLSLLAHYILQPDQRRAMKSFFTGLSIVLLLSATFFILGLLLQVRELRQLSFYILVLLPLAFLFPIFRRNVPGFDVRANQMAIIVLFTLLVGLTVAAGNLFLKRFPSFANFNHPLEIVLVILAIIFFAFIFPIYERWAQKYLLKITLPREDMLQQFSRMIVTSLDTNHLAEVFHDHLAPSLLIRQLALLRIDEQGAPTVITLLGVDESELPAQNQIKPLLDVSGRYLDNHHDGQSHPAWVRLAFTLAVEGHADGLCLLGRRDPDDTYTPFEIHILQSLMDQAALALRNIAQAERLHAFHQANIQRHENERQSLARELHDDVLGQMSLMIMNAPPTGATETFQTSYKNAVAHVRAIIAGLRPAMLHYGLGPAMDELCDEMRAHFHYDFEMVYNVTGRDVRLPPDVEMHIYRILQEACTNALRHGKATRLVTTGWLKPDDVLLEVVDNGSGFSAGGQLDLTWLLGHRHFGLANIYERAALIGAEVAIHSKPGQGARVTINWRA